MRTPGARVLAFGLIVAGLVFLGLWRFTTFGRRLVSDFLSPFHEHADAFAGDPEKQALAGRSKAELVNEVAELRAELQEHRGADLRAAALARENEDLRGLLKLPERTDYDYVACRVVTRDPAAGGRRLRISRGSKAGIRPVYAQLPAERILRRIRLSDSPFCSLGWFRTPERRGVGRFSLPVYRNQPIQLLVRRRDAERFAEVHAFTDLAGTDALLGVTRGFSYGPYLDLQIAELPHRQLDRTTANQPALVRMLTKGRIDAVLVAPEERQGLLLSSGIDPERFLAIDLADVPRGNARHIWCSRSTPPEFLKRIDDAIRALGLGR